MNVRGFATVPAMLRWRRAAPARKRSAQPSGSGGTNRPVVGAAHRSGRRIYAAARPDDRSLTTGTRGCSASIDGGTGRQIAFRPCLLLLLIAVCLVGCGERRSAEVKVKLKNADERVKVERDEGGALRFVLKTPEGPRTIEPSEFAELVYTQQTHRPWYLRLLNVTSLFGVIWVTVGLGGQIMFSLRMLVQWLASEKHKRSMVPVAFWWLSLAGAMMMMVYFTWRKDIIGVLGQVTGVAVYLRNLYMIYGPSHEPVPYTADPAPEPELDR